VAECIVIVSPEVSATEVALVYCAARAVLTRFSEAEIFGRKAGEPLPRGAMTCGEATMLALNIVAMSVRLFPKLVDDEHAQMMAAMSHASGRVQ
jgi:hypothetical protein